MNLYILTAWLLHAQEAVQFEGKVVRLPFEKLAGDAQGLTSVLSGLSLPNVVLLDNRGVIVMGEDVGSAFSRLCNLERCCQVLGTLFCTALSTKCLRP